MESAVVISKYIYLFVLWTTETSLFPRLTILEVPIEVPHKIERDINDSRVFREGASDLLKDDDQLKDTKITNLECCNFIREYSPR